ncbi:MAG: heme o synthase [Cyclobacteriaceae bacterium]
MENTTLHTTITIGEKVKAYIELLKVRLSLLVVFSAGMTYMLGLKTAMIWSDFILFLLGGFLITGGANIINQIKEKEFDKMMKRTMNRPLPTGKISPIHAAIYSFLLVLSGFLLILNYANLNTALLALLSVVLYGFAYTPLKRVGPIAVLIGAIPGALPPMIGWVAITNSFSYEAFLLFGIQFIWQFPHFWAIAWLGYDDYKKAGFELLPSRGGRDMNTAINIMIYTLFLIPMSLLPTYVGMVGQTAGIVVGVSGVLFLALTFHLMKTCSRQAALKMMLGSVIYLPIVQIAYVMDKI